MVVPTRVLIKTCWVEQLVRGVMSVYLGTSGSGHETRAQVELVLSPDPPEKRKEVWYSE